MNISEHIDRGFDEEDEGVIKYIREDDNHDGLRLNIDTIEKLLQFFECLEKIQED